MNNARRSDVFVDLCLQRDYLSPDGAQPALNAPLILPNLKHLMAFARWAHVPTLSCIDLRRPNDVRGLPAPACVAGTLGQQKLPFALLPDRLTVESDNSLCVALNLLQQHQQIIFAKQHRDPFTNPKLDRLLTEAPARRFVVFGAGVEHSLRLLALGLLLRGRRVTVVYDACGYWNAEDGVMAVRQLDAKGCELVSTQQLIDSAVAQHRRTHHRPPRRRSVA